MTIEEQVRADHPQFVVREKRREHIVSPETDAGRYEAMIAERVVWATDAESAATAETADRQLRRQVREALADLDQSADILLGPGNVTAATQRFILGRLCRIVAALIRVLIRRGIVGDG